MAAKNYNIGGKEYTVDGNDELHGLLDALQTQNQTLQTRIDSTPSLESQLKIWEKAKPIFEKAKKEIDYSLSPTEVMKKSLELSGYDIKDIDEKTANYVFSNVLKVETTDIPGTNSDKKEPQKPDGIKPSQATGNGMTSTEMGSAWLNTRMSGTATPATASNN